MWRSLRNYLAHLMSREPAGWHPLLAVVYLTYHCDLRCSFCSDGAGRPYHALREQPLDISQWRQVLARLRHHCDFLVLTGGEPLLYPQLTEVLEALPNLRFDGVTLTTNGIGLERMLGPINGAVRDLVVSLNSLDRATAARICSGPPDTLDQILEGLNQAAAYPSRSYGISISSVATPENLDDVREIYAFAKERGFGLAVCPQLLGVKAHPDLAGNEEYRALFDFLIAEKRRGGGGVFGTVAYLEHMRDLKEFRCRPSTVVAVSPGGNVFYPCLELSQPCGNLLEHEDLHSLRRAGREQYGPEPSCDNRCHSACALGFALALNRPWSMLSELRYGR